MIGLPEVKRLRDLRPTGMVSLGVGLTLAGLLAGTPVLHAQVPTRQARVTVPAANVRAGPGTNYEVLVVVRERTVLPVIWDDGRWFQVTLSPKLGTDEELGFIHASTVRVEELKTDPDSTAPAGDPTQGSGEGRSEPTDAATGGRETIPVTVISPTPAGGDEETRFGLQVAAGEDTETGIGVRVEQPVPTVSPRLRLLGSLDFFFPEGIHVDQWDVNVAALYQLAPERGDTFTPYAGAGVNLVRVSSTVFAERESGTHLGLGFFGGLRFAVADLNLFAEVRAEVGGGDQLVLVGGVLF